MDGEIAHSDAAKPKKASVPWSNALPDDDHDDGGAASTTTRGGGGASSEEIVISESQMIEQELAAMHLPFAEVVVRFERVAETKGGEAKRAAFFNALLHQKLKVGS